MIPYDVSIVILPKRIIRMSIFKLFFLIHKNFFQFNILNLLIVKIFSKKHKKYFFGHFMIFKE